MKEMCPQITIECSDMTACVEELGIGVAPVRGLAFSPRGLGKMGVVSDYWSRNVVQGLSEDWAT